MLKRFYAFPILILAAFLLTYSAISAQDKLPAELAGKIGEPLGSIAFIRDGHVWITDIDKGNPRVVTEVSNADGRLSWAPDNKRIVFTRKGQFQWQSPDLMGGLHKLYDIFIAYTDSAEAHNTMFWRRISSDLGGRDPEWEPDGRIMFLDDMNAQFVDAPYPNYQICFTDDMGSKKTIMRPDWERKPVEGEKIQVLSAPTYCNGKFAAVLIYDFKPVGTVIMTEEELKTLPYDALRKRAQENARCVAPAWSPDGKWLAYVYNDINDEGLYIATPDMKEKYQVFTPPVGAHLYTVAPSFSPDGKWLTFSTNDDSVWICDITGNNARRISGPGTDKFPAWSK